MSVNRYKRHLMILPEDDANRQLANGFVLHCDTNQIAVLKEAGGWVRARESLASEQAQEMRKYPERLLLLLIDLDGRSDRVGNVLRDAPPDLVDRVFVVGSKTNPEDLRREGLGSLESIGASVARGCREGVLSSIWRNDLLSHNDEQLARLRANCEQLLS